MISTEILADRWAGLPRQAGLALLYALLATITVEQFSDHAFVSYVWPPSGLALAALLIGGKKYWFGILLGALAYNLVADHSVWLSACIALGNTLEAFAAFRILSRMRPMADTLALLPRKYRLSNEAGGLDPALTHPRDYIRLIGVGALTSAMGALIGTTALFLAGFLAPPAFPHSLLQWWMGDTLGIMLVAPLILVWRQTPQDWLTRRRAPELLGCFLLAFLCGQAVFLDWFDQTINRGYWMFLFVTWGAVRFGRHGVLLIITLAGIQGLLGAAKGVGYFGAYTGQAQLSQYWFYMAVLTLIGMLLATVIKERELAEAALRASEERFRSLTQLGSDCYWEVNEHLRFTEITGGKLFHENLSLLKRIGKNFWEVGIVGFDEAAWKSHRALLERHESFRNFEIGRLDENIQLHVISLSGEPVFDETRRFIGYRGVGSDITLRKQAEEALKLAAGELRRQKNEAERTSLAKSRFLAAASHDLRQPLHALSLFAAELEQQTNTLTQRRLLQQISTAIDAMNQQLNPLLDISRLDLGDAVPRREAVALQPLIERVVAMQRHGANAKGLSLRLIPTTAWGESDAYLLERMIGNLISNAVRYTSEGGVVVGVRRSGSDWRIEIRDSGIGIAREQLSLIFQEFYQIDNPERDAGKGLGLGLAIVARLGQMLNHPIKVCSSAGLGSVFGIILPQAPPSILAQNADESPRAGNFDFNAKVLLGCGDDAASVHLRNLLEGWGCRVTHAVDDAALRLALTDQPEVLICDDRGYAAATAYYSARQAAAPILILLGAPPSAAPLHGLAMHGHLAKPVQPARLRALLQHLLEESEILC